MTVHPDMEEAPVVVRDRRVPRRYSLKVEHDDGRPELALGFEVRDGVPQCRRAELRSTEDGREVTASDLRGVRLEDLLELALVNVAMTFASPDIPQEYWPNARERPDLALSVWQGSEQEKAWQTEDDKRQTLETVRGVRRESRRKVTDDLLREVARVYRENVASTPTAAVAAFTGRAHRTAALYVKQAREAGFLGPTTRGKAGEQP